MCSYKGGFTCFNVAPLPPFSAGHLAIFIVGWVIPDAHSSGEQLQPFQIQAYRFRGIYPYSCRRTYWKHDNHEIGAGLLGTTHDRHKQLTVISRVKIPATSSLPASSIANVTTYDRHTQLTVISQVTFPATSSSSASSILSATFSSLGTTSPGNAPHISQGIISAIAISSVVVILALLWLCRCARKRNANTQHLPGQVSAFSPSHADRHQLNQFIVNQHITRQKDTRHQRLFANRTLIAIGLRIEEPTRPARYSVHQEAGQAPNPVDNGDDVISLPPPYTGR